MKTKLFTLALAALTVGLLGSCKKEDPKVSVTGVTLDKPTLEITVGDPDVKLTATVAPENATDKTVSWSSDKTEFATVDNQGNVHAVAPGIANITVTTTDGNKTATCAVTVKAAKVPVTGVTLDKTTLEITVGDPDVKLAATVLPENATDKTVSWSSDKTEFATVDNQGNVHAVAPGTANITVTTADGNKTATCVVTVKAALPEGALSGEFSVSAAKKVHFSKGNLYWDGDSFELETNQYDVQSSWSTSHVSHFFWSKDASVAYAASYSESGTAVTDVFFTNATAETAKADFTVNGVTGEYRTLSKDEWNYLFSRTSKHGFATVGGVYGIIILPDTFTDPMKNGGSGAFKPLPTQGYDKNVYTIGGNWEAMESAGAVFLPATNFRKGTNFDQYSSGSGFYWSSIVRNASRVYGVIFNEGIVYPNDSDHERKYGRSVRLVTEVPASASTIEDFNKKNDDSSNWN